MNTQRQSGRVAIKIDNIENKTNNFNQSEDSKYTKFIYFTVLSDTPKIKFQIYHDILKYEHYRYK